MNETTTEQAFVGMAILGRREVLSACKIVQPAHLTSDFCRDAYRTVRQCHGQGRWPSESVVVDKLKAEYSDARERVWQCCANIGKSFDPMPFAIEILRGAQVRARLLAVERYTRETTETLDDTNALPALRESLDQASKMYAVPESIEDVYEAAKQDMTKRRSRFRSGGAAGIPTGFAGVDEMTGGWQAGINIVGGWSSCGKTAVLTGSVVACMANKVRPRIYTIDMGPFPLTWRVASHLGQINLGLFSTGRLSDEQSTKYESMCDRMLAAGCAIDRRHTDIDSICASLVEYRDTYDIAFIDYAQKIGVKGRLQEKDRIEQVLSGLVEAQAALDGKPIVLLSQLTDPPTGRDIDESKECPRPNSNQLRGNRYLNDFAQVVVLVWRADYKRPDNAGSNAAELIVDKNQNGPTGPVRAFWDAKYARFVEDEDADEVEEDLQGKLI